MIWKTEGNWGFKKIKEPILISDMFWVKKIPGIENRYFKAFYIRAIINEVIKVCVTNSLSLKTVSWEFSLQIKKLVKTKLSATLLLQRAIWEFGTAY